MLRHYAVIPKIWMKLLKIDFGKNLKMQGWPFVFKSRSAKLSIGNNCSINSSFLSNLIGLYQRTIVFAYKQGVIKIGNDVGISGSTIFAVNQITIGDKTIIGGNTKILDNDFHPLDAEQRRQDINANVKSKPIFIGENVFVGCNCIILKGTVLGDNCVVGAGSVVCGKFEANSLLAGNPAVVIKKY